MALYTKTVTRPKLQAAVLKWFADEQISFEQETALANCAAAEPIAGLLDVGTVMGKVTSSGKVVPLAPAAADGSQIAIGIVVDAVTVPAAADQPVVLLERLGVVLSDNLVWPAGITGAQQTTALGQLAAAFVIVRAS